MTNNIERSDLPTSGNLLSFYYQRRDVHLKEGCWRLGDHELYELVLQDIRRAMVVIWQKCRHPQSDQELQVASSETIYNRLNRFLYREKKGQSLSPRRVWEKSGGTVSEEYLLIGGSLPKRNLIFDISGKFFVRLPSKYLQTECGTGQFLHFEKRV